MHTGHCDQMPSLVTKQQFKSIDLCTNDIDEHALQRWIYGGLTPPIRRFPAAAPPLVVVNVSLPSATDHAASPSSIHLAHIQEKFVLQNKLNAAEKREDDMKKLLFQMVARLEATEAAVKKLESDTALERAKLSPS